MDVRGRLQKAGVPVRDVQDAAHLFVFVQAAATVKHVLAPQHKSYGEVAEVYSRLPRVASIVPLWDKYLDGKLSRAEALEQIVQEVAAKTKEKPASL
jgi:hypothetical protein